MRKKLTLEISAEELRPADVHLALLRATFMLTHDIIHTMPPTVLSTAVQGVDLVIRIEEEGS